MNRPHEKQKTKALIQADQQTQKTFYFTKISFVLTEL